MANIDRKISEGVQKVRLKTASGVMRLCYRSSPSGQANNSPETSSAGEVSRGGGQVSGAEESGFGSLPELFDFQDRNSIAEGSFLYLSPDFSTYNFWDSESCRGLSHGAGFLDTFPICDLAGKLDNAPGLESTVVAQPDDLQNLAILPDPLSQNSMNSSCIEEEMTNRKSYWDFPLELEEDIFESTTNSNLLKEVTETHFDEVRLVEDYLVDSSPQLSDVVTNVENIDSNLLVYAPNRYLEDACIFQSSPADLETRLEIRKSDVETLIQTVGRERILDSQKGSLWKRRRLRENWMENGNAIDTAGRDSATASCIEDSDLEDVTAKKPISQIGQKAQVPLSIHHCVNPRRRRFSAPGLKRSKFLEPTSQLASLEKPSPNQANREIKPGRPGRSPIRKFDSFRRLLKPGYCSNSSEESDHNRHKRPPGETLSQPSVPADCGTEQSCRSAKISLRGSASPLKEITNRSFDRGATRLELTSNPCLLRKKRTGHKDVHDRLNTSKTAARLDAGNHSPDSPKNSKFTTASSPCGSPTIAQVRRSPWDSRKKVRTFRRRPQSSPASAKKLHFFGKISRRGSSQVVHGTPSSAEPGVEPGAELEAVHPRTESIQRKKRRRVPLPQSSVEILQMWVQENLPDPYPSRLEKEDLVIQTGLKMSQIDNWLGNARQKLKFKSRAVKDLCSESSSSPPLPRKPTKRKRLYPLKMQI